MSNLIDLLNGIEPEVSDSVIKFKAGHVKFKISEGFYVVLSESEYKNLKKKPAKKSKKKKKDESDE